MKAIQAEDTWTAYKLAGLQNIDSPTDYVLLGYLKPESETMV